MKKNYFLLSALFSSTVLLSFSWNSNAELETYYQQSHKDSSGAPAGRTGAPGEQNCTACHSGTVQSAVGINSIVISDANGPVNSYEPDSVYTVTVSMVSASPKNGFEIVSLTSSNAQAGTVTITDATHTKVVTGSASKKYVTHKTAGNTLTSWSYSWKAPATNVGNITFYLATNETNNNGQENGDIIRLSNMSIGSTAGIKENEAVADVSVGFSSNNNALNIQMDAMQNGQAAINLVDLNGKSVQFEELGAVSKGKNGFTVLLKNNIPSGIYIAHISLNNNFVTKKIYID